MKARWKQGFHAKVSADIAATEFERIRQKNGGNLEAPLVHDEISKKRNPLHNTVEWNDSIAGKEYRLYQIRNMLRAIEVIYLENDIPTPSRLFEVISIKPEASPKMNVYRTLEDILADPEQRKQLLMRAKRELAACRKRYKDLTELSNVFDAIDSILD